MDLILAVEPDAAHAEVLARMLPGRAGADLVVVASVPAALTALGGRRPDVLLLGSAVPADDQAHLLSACTSPGAEQPERLDIPVLRTEEASGGKGGDATEPTLFADRVAMALERAHRRQIPSSGPADDPVPNEAALTLEDLFPLSETSVFETSDSWRTDAVRASDAQAAGGADTFGAELESMIRQLGMDTDAALIQIETTDAFEPEALPFVDSPFQFPDSPDQATSTSIIDLLAGMPDEGRSAPGAATIDFGMSSPDDSGSPEAHGGGAWASPGEEPDGARSEQSASAPPGEAPADLIDPEVHAAELALAQVRADARLASEVERVRAEAAARHAQDLARFETDAAAARKAAVLEARAAADAEARAALARELARVRSEAEDKLIAELARVRAEAAQSLTEQIGRTWAEADQVLEAQLARAQVEAEAVRVAALDEARTAAEATAARALASEVARVQAESEDRLNGELARMRAEAEQERLTHEQARREADLRQDQEARAARDAADAEAARHLAAEVARVQEEVEARLEAELARLHRDAARLRDTDEAPALGSEAPQARDAAGEDARAGADAAARLAVETEVAQIRAQAEAQLQAELAQLRFEADEARRLRDEAERQAHEARDAAARDARETAEETAARTLADEARRVRQEAESRVAAETDRARRDAESRLSSELETFTADVERRRQQEIQELRRQMAQLRDSALRQDHVRQDHARQEDLVMAGGYHPAWPDQRRVERRSWLLHSAWPRKAAGAAVLLAAASFVVDLPTVVRTGTALVSARFGDGDERTDRAGSSALPLTGPAPAAQVAAPASTRVPRAAGSAPRPVVTAPGAASGTFSVQSRIPLDVYSGARRIGTSDAPIVLAAGPQTLRLVSNRYNYRDEITIDVRPGAVTRHAVALPTGQLRVRSAPGAEVLVDGDLIGLAPLVEAAVPIGTREVIVRHAALGVRRATVEVRHQLPADLILPLERGVDTPARTPQMPPLSRAPAR